MASRPGPAAPAQAQAQAIHPAHERGEKRSASSSSSSSRRRPRFLAKVVLYVVTGILQPVLIDSLRMRSCLGRKVLLLPTLANVLGMACCGALATAADRTALVARLRADGALRRSLLLTAAVDLLSGMLLTSGILLTGGAVFVVLYNSCPAWTALLSWRFLDRPLSSRQAGGVVVVCLGLMANVLGTSEQLRGGGGGGDDAATVAAGSFVVLLGCVLHSAFFVLSERSLRGHRAEGGGGAATTSCGHHGNDGEATAVPPPLWSGCLGTMETAFMSMWVLSGMCTGGFRDPASASSCAPSEFSEGFSLLLLVDAVHAAAFFLLLKQIGAVGSALLKGLQAVAVVLLSASFFCSREAAQCLTVAKGFSIVLVISGTLLYAVGRNEERSEKRSPPEGNRANDGPEGLPSVERESLLA